MSQSELLKQMAWRNAMGTARTDAVILSEKVVERIDTYDEMSEHELLELADALGYVDED